MILASRKVAGDTMNGDLCPGAFLNVSGPIKFDIWPAAVLLTVIETSAAA